MQTDEKGRSAHSKPMMLCDPLITPQPFHRKVKNCFRITVKMIERAWSMFKESLIK